MAWWWWAMLIWPISLALFVLLVLMDTAPEFISRREVVELLGKGGEKTELCLLYGRMYHREGDVWRRLDDEIMLPSGGSGVSDPK